MSVSHPLFGFPSQLANPNVQLGLQTPDAHAVVPFGLRHLVPHDPQFALVSNATSQPFVASPSQLPKFALQVIAHAPARHVAVPLLLLQALPQAPQFEAFVSVLTSQPFEAAPSQLPNPTAHVPRVQVPLVHDSLAFARSHTLPHVPQSVSVARLASQPFTATPSQLPNPALHAWSWQPPLKHVAEAFAKTQACPHPPQLPTLEFRLVSQPFPALPSQSPNPGSQAIWQFPPEHVGLPLAALHTRPQVPQLVGSVAVDTSHPVAYERSQFEWPALQLPIAQVVPRQAGVPFWTEHTVPQPPQFWTLFVVAVSHPFLRSASQLPKPAAHVMLHTPDVQNANPFVESHPSPQPPQFFALVSVLVSQPLETTPSQSAKGGKHDAMVHVPVVQLVFAFGSTHTWPQAPQFKGVESRASQPSW